MSLTWSPLPLSPISSVLHCDLRDLPLKGCGVVAVQFRRPSQYWYGPLICQLNGNEDVPQRSCLILPKSGKGLHAQFICRQSCMRTKRFVKHQIYVKRQNLCNKEIISLLTKPVNDVSHNILFCMSEQTNLFPQKASWHTVVLLCYCDGDGWCRCAFLVTLPTKRDSSSLLFMCALCVGAWARGSRQ